ncbi:PepSY domain-containing protein [Shinella sp. CPCC 101442]|uniref:PepSY domain-containing protein n=1 Tax=Shinella sp. CPCC 101442 TaxID=2932265 RepID=UPI0021528E7F|nr:PepSY domain-containing protein [Shinella sp. CPCC 101442]MCR6501788.1 PepSY domain-containing protein [Shinella sp. CPCC 101442]
MITRFILGGGALILLPFAAFADEAKVTSDTSSLQASEILSSVERRPDFARISGMSWNDKGYYEIEYRTRDKAKVEINIDAKSGQPVDQE